MVILSHLFFYWIHIYPLVYPIIMGYRRYYTLMAFEWVLNYGTVCLSLMNFNAQQRILLPRISFKHFHIRSDDWKAD